MSLSGASASLKDFIIEESIADKDVYVDAHNPTMVAEAIYISLRKALKEDRIMLVDYEWNILPKEQIRITVTTNELHKEFSIGF